MGGLARPCLTFASAARMTAVAENRTLPPGVPDFGHLAGGEEEHSDFVVGREMTRHQHLCMHTCTGFYFFFMAAAGVLVL